MEPIFNNGGHQSPAVEPQRAISVPEELRKLEILHEAGLSGLVVVHCRHTSELGGGIRIWRSTFLCDRDSATRSALLHVFGITVAPDWLYVEPGSTVHFILVFAPLPKSCTVFDFLEEIPEPGGFYVPNIPRNRHDVYRVEII